MENVATYSEARSEYTKQLAVFIVGPIVSWFQDLWSRNSMDKQNCLVNFQTKCEEVAKWNQDRIHDEVRVLLERSGCDYMEDLVTAVFIAHAKVLTAVRITARPQKMNLTIPKLDHFIHHIYRECARAFWKTPYLFMTTPGDVVGRQRNIIQIEALATEAITTAVRGLLPVKDILRDCFEGSEEVVEEDAGGAAVGGGASSVAEVPVAPPVVAEVPVAPSVAPPVVAEVPVAPSVAPPVVAPPNEEPEIKSILKVKSSPATVSIQTEPAVHFSDYVSEFDETKEGPQIRYNPKPSAEDIPDRDDPDDEEEERLQIDESSAQPLSFNDIEDLDGPTATPAPAPAPPMGPEEVILE
jgi:hypothetical protein